MENTEHPCTDCPGIPGGCYYDTRRNTCVSSKRVNQLIKLCEGRSALSAYQMIELLSGSDEFIWPPLGGLSDNKTKIRLSTYIDFDDVIGYVASDVRFKFWGGPPNQLHYYDGSLETMLKDRLLYRIHTYGIVDTQKAIGVTDECFKTRHELCNV